MDGKAVIVAGVAVIVAGGGQNGGWRSRAVAMCSQDCSWCSCDCIMRWDGSRCCCHCSGAAGFVAGVAVAVAGVAVIGASVDAIIAGSAAVELE